MLRLKSSRIWLNVHNRNKISSEPETCYLLIELYSWRWWELFIERKLNHSLQQNRHLKLLSTFTLERKLQNESIKKIKHFLKFYKTLNHLFQNKIGTLIIDRVNDTEEIYRTNIIICLRRVMLQRHSSTMLYLQASKL